MTGEGARRPAPSYLIVLHYTVDDHSRLLSLPPRWRAEPSAREARDPVDGDRQTDDDEGDADGGTHGWSGHWEWCAAPGRNGLAPFREVRGYRLIA
jgi:hypothetical protein